MDTDKNILTKLVNCFKYCRLPWRLEYFIKRHILFWIFGNPNTKGFWNKKLSEMESERWRDYVYFDIADLLPKEGSFSLLDIGCALGDGCIYFKTRFPKADISGCDFSDKAIGVAKKKSGGINFSVLDILSQDIPGEYDYITLVSILEHFDDPYKVIDKCLRHSRKAVIINCPYAKDITYDIRDEHRFAFNEDSLKDYNHEFIIKPDQKEPDKKRIIYTVREKRG